MGRGVRDSIRAVFYIYYIYIYIYVIESTYRTLGFSCDYEDLKGQKMAKKNCFVITGEKNEDAMLVWAHKAPLVSHSVLCKLGVEW